MSPERPLLSISRKDLDHGPKHVRAEVPAAWLARKLTETAAATTAAATSAAGAKLEPVSAEPQLAASSNGVVDVNVTPAGGENFLIQGKVTAIVDATCGRCLGPARVPVDAELTMLMVPSADAVRRAPKGRRAKESEGEFEFDPAEADVATYDGETLVFDDLVREAILLELPISPLCSEDCAGMRSDPAVAEKLAAARVDPRLAKLAELRSRFPAK